MHSSCFLASCFALFALIPCNFAAPTPADHVHGDFVGVRPTAYEEKHPDHSKISIHPGVVVGGPYPENGKYKIAMISKKLPHDPPQAPITNFHPHSSAYGNVALSPAKIISPEHMKPWKDDKTGVRQTPLHPNDLHRLKAAMQPHAGWRAPTPPPKPPTPPPHSMAGANGRYVNPHASGLKHPAPPGYHHGAPVARHPTPGGSHHGAPPRHPVPGHGGPYHGVPGPRHPAPGGSHPGASGSRRPSTPGHPAGHKEQNGKPPSFKPNGGHPARKPAGVKRSLRFQY